MFVLDESLKTILIQGIGLLGTLFYFLSYQFKDNKTLFRVQFLAYFCYTIHYFLLGAATGAFSYIVNLLRSLFLSVDNEKLNGKTMGVLLCLLQIIAGIMTWNGWISVLPIIANIATTIAGYSFHFSNIRKAGIFINSPLWMLYNILVGSFAGILDEIISEASMILSVVRYGWEIREE